MPANYLDSFVNFEFNLKNLSSENFQLDRIKYLLKLLGDPQKDLKIIHVAGSKGKGSTCAVIAQILKEAGYRVGLYTSPHIYNYRERIRILDSKKTQQLLPDAIFSDTISEEEMDEGLKKIKPSIDKINAHPELGALTFFEVFTALAFYYFKEQKTDFVVVETGLGGRLDATNAASSLVAVITPISLEHTQILGETLEKIACEKAAIIKDKKQKVVIAPQDPEAKKVFKKRCQEIEAECLFVDEEIECKSIEQNLNGQSFSIKTKQQIYSDLKSPLIGKHQLANITVAVGVVESLQDLGVRISREAMDQGIKSVYWPGRFEIIQKNPLVILDGAHNEASAKVLVNTIEEMLPHKKVTLILGVSNDKNKKSISDELNKITQKVIITKANHPRADDFAQSELKEIFPSKEIYFAKNTAEALELAQQKTQKDEIILVTGSLFVVAEVRKLCLN